jgi:hypothetical protein
MECGSHFPYGFFFQTKRVLFKTFKRRTEDAWELLEKTSRLLKHQVEYLPASGCFKYSRGLLSTKTCQIKRNRRNPAKNSSNPRTPKTPKSSPLTHGFGKGIKGKRTTKGSRKFPPSNPQEQGPENIPRKPPREGSENHHQEQQGTTQQSLEEPRRIIYTYQGGSYKV